MTTTPTIPTLPVQGAPITPPGVATPGASTAAADFLAMLAQFLGAANQQNAAAAGALPAVAARVNGDAGDVDTDAQPAAGLECAGLAVLLPVAAEVASALPSTTEGGQEELVLAVAEKAVAIGATDGGAGARMLDELLQSVDDPAAIDLSATDMTPAPLVAALPDKPAITHAADSVLSRPVQAPVGSEAWADEVATRLTWMAEQGRHTASLKLSPEHLGPLEIRIAVRDDQATVWFGAAHADTRAAIEHALPRLRELFASQGLSLADAGVFREPPRDQPRMGQNAGGGADAAHDEGQTIITTTHVGLVDAYA